MKAKAIGHCAVRAIEHRAVQDISESRQVIRRPTRAPEQAQTPAAPFAASAVGQNIATSI